MNKTLIFVVIAVLVLGGGYLLMSQQKASPATAPSTGEGTTQDQNRGNETDVLQEDKESTTSVGNALQEEGSTLKADVTISGYAFSPATIRVKVGGTVTWTNQDPVAHTVTADGGSFDTKLISQGKSASVTFDKAGTYPYHCTPHPNMKGTVIVE